MMPLKQNRTEQKNSGNGRRIVGGGNWDGGQ